MGDDQDARTTAGSFEQRLNRLDEAIDRLQPRANRWQQNFDWGAKNFFVFSAVAGAVGTVVLGLWGGGKLYIQTQDLIDRTDRRISAIVGASQPDTASVFGLVGPEDRTIRYSASLEPARIGRQTYYRLFLQARLRVSITGEPGTITGYYVYLEGKMLDAAALGFDGQPDELIKLSWGSPFGENYSESEAEIITSKSSGTIGVSWSISLKDCNRALEVLEKLTSSEEEEMGKTWIVPVFRYIEDAPEFRGFNNQIVRGAVFDCYDEGVGQEFQSSFEDSSELESTSVIDDVKKPSTK
ncbi:hypothetical protein C8J29_101818 [Cereibacter johrii]|uniref:Uncharacterized protein n=2 Tax=Cereibacter johrii TaxID=445629 RepID=A0ABX5JDH0_9RHOB|nr:hypothetical protein [Cereibacter johrii]PTM81871.1 hypothetical protein C8J29_101818 [Cereibacter johrii]